MAMPSWFVMGGAILTLVTVAALVFRDMQKGSHRGAEKQLADDIEAWLRARETAA
jgi:hypothetical protein